MDRWTQLPAGRVQNATQHLLVSMGEHAEMIVALINLSKGELAQRMVDYALTQIDETGQLIKFESGSEFSATNHTINLFAPPRLPFDGAEVVKHEGKRVVEIELRSDDNLYIDGKKVILHLSEHQMGDKQVAGHELRKELEDGSQVLLNSNVLDYLYDHPELFPEHWKQNEKGETLYISFWGSVFRNPSHGDLYVRYLYWFNDELRRNFNWLGNGWDRQFPSASVAS